MKISLLSSYGKSLALGLVLQSEGHDVTLYLLNPINSNIGEGLIPIKNKATGFNADLIINDNMSMGSISNKLRKMNKLVIGGSEVTDRLSNDRAFGLSIMDGVKIPVLSPKGEAGIKMSVGAWFNGSKFCKPYSISFDYDHLMPQDRGPEIKEMGVVMAYRSHARLFHETLAKSETYLKLTGYKGYIGLRCLIVKDKTYGLEWITGFDYPSLFCQLSLHEEGKIGSFLSSIAKGTTGLLPADTSKWCIGVSYNIMPPYISLDGIEFPDKLDSIYFRNIYKKDDKYYPTDEAGSICIVIANDINLKKAKEKVYKEIDKIKIPYGFCRPDIGESFIEQFQILKKNGWIK